MSAEPLMNMNNFSASLRFVMGQLFTVLNAFHVTDLLWYALMATLVSGVVLWWIRRA